MKGLDLIVPMAEASTPTVLSGVECSGTESGLSYCAHASSIIQCNHTMDAGAMCSKAI